MSSSSHDEGESSPNPKFWLEFRTFDDGLHPVTTPTLAPPFRTFPQFAQLPAELRLKIWEYLVQPRIVVACCLERDHRLAERKAQLAQRSGSDDASPVLLRISREARAVGLQHYERTFGWRISKLLSDTPVSRPAGVWFNYALDALYLTGELEAFDAYGFNSPMVYFLRSEDTRRVRHVACTFAELGYPRLESDQIFGCLWHVADRFRRASRLLLAVSLGAGDGDGVVEVENESGGRETVRLGADNVMQKIWDGLMGGVRGMGGDAEEMVDKKMVLVREEDLAEAMFGE
ncbi:hypothetical protein K4F52_005088 [Lecanicillium sp. MT-2017a]|nr:hypothetical protein K4F52_005088 [Lecanicillium sp. MT-2017a]